MRIHRVVAGAMASVLALGAVTPAFADNDHRDRREWREDRRDDRREHRHDRRDWERDRREARRDYRDDRRDWRRDHDRRYYHPAPPPPRVVHRPGYRPGPGYGWQVGHRYRDYYRGPVYVVNDYPRYHLRRPPYGHQWIRDDRGNMLLVAIATGVIAQYVLSR